MAQFDKDSPSSCPQCGGNAGYVYHQNEGPSGAKQGASACARTAGSKTGEPHMHRTCMTCKYQWAEEPILT